MFFINLSHNPNIIKTIETGYIALSTGIEIERIILRPKLQIKNDTTVIIMTHFVYDIFLNLLLKNVEIEFVSPIQVVRHANVNIAASTTAPNPPNSSYIVLLNINAPLASGKYTPDVYDPIIVNIK